MVDYLATFQNVFKHFLTDETRLSAEIVSISLDKAAISTRSTESETIIPWFLALLKPPLDGLEG